LEDEALVTRFRQADREVAGRWLEDYGDEQGRWMLQRCVELHRRAKGDDAPIFSFKGLQLYEMKALADYSKQQLAQRRQERLSAEEIEGRWEEYRASQLTEARSQLNQKEQDDIEEQAKGEVESLLRATRGGIRTPVSALSAIIQANIEERLMEITGAITEEEFRRSLEG